jgi:HD-like signal output (HDOD) protein
VGFDSQGFRQEARGTARLARRLAQEEGAPAEMADQAETAGLLHNLGRLALAVNLPDQYRVVTTRMKQEQLPDWEAEQAVFGATHGEVGGSLLGLWGLPMAVVEAVALHDHPACFLTKAFSPLTAVHVAKALWQSTTLEDARKQIDRDYLSSLGLHDRLPAWWHCRGAVLGQADDA